MPLRNTPARWLVIYCILATAIGVGLVVALRNRDRDANERSARIEALCRVGRENRAAVRDLLRDGRPIPTFGIPLADAPIRQYNAEQERRNERIDRRFSTPIPDCAMLGR